MKERGATLAARDKEAAVHANLVIDVDNIPKLIGDFQSIKDTRQVVVRCFIIGR